MLKVRQFQNYWFQGMIVLREASLLKKKTKKWTMTQFFPAYQSRICKKEKQISIFCRKFTTSFAKTSVVKDCLEILRKSIHFGWWGLS